jgi:ABC-type phosphate transport system permease subunit
LSLDRSSLAPFSYSIWVAANFPSVEIGIWTRIVLHPVMRKNSWISMAENILPDNLNAVV